MLASSPEADTFTNFASHYNLLQDAINSQLGPIAGKIIQVLRDRSPLTLKELADTILPRDDSYRNQVMSALDARNVGSSLCVTDDTALDTDKALKERLVLSSGRTADSNNLSVLTDAAIKELMTRLVLHRVVVYNGEAHTYTLQVGYGVLLHVLYPSIAQAARRRYGGAGEVLILVVRQLALVPWDAAIRLAQERRPCLPHEAVVRAAKQLEEDGWVEFTNSAGSSGGADPARKRGRVETGNVAHDITASEASRLCVEVILLDLLHDAIFQWVDEHYMDHGVASAVVSVFLCSSKLAFIQQTHSNKPSERPVRPHGYPLLQLESLSPFLSPLMLRDAAADQCRTGASISLNSIIVAVKGLSCVTSNVSQPLLVSAESHLANAPGNTEATMYRFSYTAAVRVLQRDVCERVTFARHGVLGVRLLKLLLRDHLLEDRTLAEGAIATQPRTRETLHAMMRDGYTYLQEAPRSGALTEQRVAKNSIFLWGCNLDRSVRPSVREQIANTLHHALAKLREVRVSAGGTDGNDSVPAKALPVGEQGGSGVLGDHPMGYTMKDASPMQALNETAGAGMEHKLSSEAVRRAVQTQRSVMGLESCSASLMRLLLIMDYY